MTEPAFIMGLAIAGTTVIVIVKTIAGAFRRGHDTRDAGQVREILDEHAATLDEYRNTIVSQGQQLAELQERVDFAERLLAQTRERAALKPGDKQD